MTAGLVRLYELAHCRAGDKGDNSILAVIPYRPEDFPAICGALSEEAVGRHFSVAGHRSVGIVHLPAIPALVVELRGMLSGGVTRSLGVDPHGKTLSFHLLAMPVTGPTPRGED